MDSVPLRARVGVLAVYRLPLAVDRTCFSESLTLRRRPRWGSAELRTVALSSEIRCRWRLGSGRGRQEAADRRQKPPPAAAVQTDGPRVGDVKEIDSQGTMDKPPVLQRVVEEMEGMGLKDTDLISRPIHYFWVSSASVALLSLLARGVLGVSSTSGGVACAGVGVLAYVLADLATGLFHFGVDNYGNSNTPVFGQQIDAFQGHHRRPWTITKRQFANNLQALARPLLFVALLLLLLPANSSRDTFVAVFFGCVMFCQQFHAWAHTPRPLLPAPVIALQDAGLLVSRKMHGAHHRPPFNCNYCIVSGICNKPLDSFGFFSLAEKVIFKTVGVAPRSWSTAVPTWLEGEALAYYEDGTDCVE